MNRRRLNLSCGSLLGLFLSLPLPSLAERLPIKTFTAADGLARDQVARIVPDSRGFLWFCTNEGLSRYDGYTFVTFGRDHGLPGRIVTDLIETRAGVYWVATSTGLYRFKPEAAAQMSAAASGMFSFDYLGVETRGHYIHTVLEDHNGVVWAGGSQGLLRLDQRDGKWILTRVDLGIGRDGRENKIEVTGLREDRHGAIWILGTTGFCRRLPDGRFEYFTEKEGIRGRLSVRALLEDRDGTIWLGTTTGLYQLISRPALNTNVVARVYTTADGLLSDHINSLLQTKDGRFWAGTGTALSELLPSADQGGHRFRNYTKANGLSSAGIGAINEDRNGNLWIGTESSGVMKIAANGFTTYGEADGLRGTRIGGLIFDRDGQLCVVGASVSGTFIQKFDGRGFDPVPLRLPPGYRYWGWGWHQTMFQARTGEWWMQMGNGVVRYPMLDRLSQLTTARPYAVYTSARDGISEEIFRIFEDSRGDVWIGGFSPGRVLVRWERRTGIFHHFTREQGFDLKAAPTAFTEDASGNLWIGFFLGGLARYANGHLTEFTSADGIPAGFIRAIYLDRASRLWVATGEGGVARLDDPSSAHPRITVYDTSNGLASNQATAITEDQWGRIYVGTGRGLDRLDPVNGNIKHFTTSDGLAGSLINVASRDRDGALWFGTVQGLSRLIPRFEEPDPQPPIVISELRAGGEAYPISALGETAVSDLTLDASQNQLRVAFVGLSFGMGETLRYQYKLEGARSDWSALTNHREVNYAGLGPGSYRFLVRAVTADGVTSSTPATVSFRILPPIWQRWWFLSLAIALLVSAAIAFDRYRAARVNELGAALDESRKLSANLTAHQTELHRANATLALEYDVTRVLADAATPSEAAPRVLEAICESGGWEVGALWDAERDTGALRCVEVWHRPNVDSTEFEAMSRAQAFPPGIGLPGRVMESGEASWISDLTGDPNFPRLASAARLGLKSAFGFPILLESQVIAVMEFFSSELREPDAEQIQMLSTIGSHIGQLIERKRTEEALRESENRFRTLAETASDAIITIDERSTILFVNPAAETVFGHTLGDMIGRELTMLMPEYVRHLHRAGFSRYLKTGDRHLSWEAIELPGLHKGGHEIPLEVSFGEFAKNGKRFFTGIIRDISERKRAEEALQHSREERLIELERVRRRIATDLHDDIGSSLTQIAILSEVIRQRVGDDASSVTEPLSMIAGASRELVDSMSDIVWAINPQKDHLTDLTQRMRRFASDSFTARNISFQLRLPETAEDIKLGANLRREVFLIFKETVNNMVRHSRCSEAEIELRFADESLLLSLRDNGCGFDVTGESDGHGLVSMRDRARGIGGTLELTSEPGRGTTTTLAVPLNPSSREVPSA